MQRFELTPEIQEIADTIYKWDYKDPAPYGYGRTTNDYYRIINPRGWKMADGSYVVLDDAELTMALKLALKRATDDDL